MAEGRSEELRLAFRQLELAEDYLQGVANAMPDLEQEVEQLLEEVAVLKQDVTKRRLAS